MLDSCLSQRHCNAPHVFVFIGRLPDTRATHE
jgi:hypothetical protein